MTPAELLELARAAQGECRCTVFHEGHSPYCPACSAFAALTDEKLPARIVALCELLADQTERYYFNDPDDFGTKGPNPLTTNLDAPPESPR